MELNSLSKYGAGRALARPDQERKKEKQKPRQSICKCKRRKKNNEGPAGLPRLTLPFRGRHQLLRATSQLNYLRRSLSRIRSSLVGRLLRYASSYLRFFRQLGR